MHNIPLFFSFLIYIFCNFLVRKLKSKLLQPGSKHKAANQEVMMQLGREGVGHVNHKPVSNIGFGKSLHGSVDVVHLDQLYICSYIMLSTKVKHFLCLLHSSYVASPNKLPPWKCNRLQIYNALSNGSSCFNYCIMGFLVIDYILASHTYYNLTPVR